MIRAEIQYRGLVIQKIRTLAASAEEAKHAAAAAATAPAAVLVRHLFGELSRLRYRSNKLVGDR